MTENLRTANAMEAAGEALGVIPKAKPNLPIFFQEGTWVAYDEAGLELARHDNYWALRAVQLLHFQCLDMTRLPQAGDTWKHHKGNEYEVLMLTNQFSDWMEYQTQVVYQGANGKVWSKGLGDFIEKMTFLRPAQSAACEPIQDLHIHSLGIKGMVAGEVYPGTDLEDAAQADITMHMHANHGGGSDHFWHAMVHVNAPTPEKAAELRDLVMKGLHMASNPFTDLSLPSISPEDAEALAKAFDSSLPGTVMAMQPALRDSEDFEALLVKYHAEVWEAAESEEDDRPGYDIAGVDLAKQLIAMFRGEAKYTHHNDLPKLLEKGELVLPATDARLADFDKARELPPLIVKLRENGQQIAEQAFDNQEAGLRAAALATRPKPPCTECKGSGGSWLAGAPAHPDNWTECDTCKGKGTV